MRQEQAEAVEPGVVEPEVPIDLQGSVWHQVH